MKVNAEIRKNTYYDSVTLMLITKEVKKIEGIEEVLVGMGTELNKELAENLNIATAEIKSLTPNDFFVTVLSDKPDILQQVVEAVESLLNFKTEEGSAEYKSNSFESAVVHRPDANMVLISVPGSYAAVEAKKALIKGMNVMIFSDNVTVEEEIELKKYGSEKGLLVMGPDCGTAIINGVPLCFANVVNKGNIGIVGASGTGTQEVSVLIDRSGGGVSQVIGTGGRDLKIEVGGIMMIDAFQALIDDPATNVIVLISKPPAPEVAEKILSMVQTTNKPVVVDFIGGNATQIVEYGAFPCCSLEDAAYKAVALSKGLFLVEDFPERNKLENFDGFAQTESEINEIVSKEAAKFTQGQKYLRALYTGGTLADEAMKILGKSIEEIYSNIPLKPQYKMKNINQSEGHTCIDLGDDEFTVGRPHPMIDPMGRVERLKIEAVDDTVAVVLMDFVLGYGSNVDPAGEMIPAILNAKKIMAEKGKYLSVIGYICGTNKDFQNYELQKGKLEEAGVIVMPSNAQAVRLTAKILSRLQ